MYHYYQGEESEAEKPKHSEIVTCPSSASKFIKYTWSDMLICNVNTVHFYTQYILKTSIFLFAHSN